MGAKGLVHVQQIELLFAQNSPHSEHRSRAEDDVRQRRVRGNDHGASHRHDVVGWIVVPAGTRVQQSCQTSRRIVADNKARIDAQLAKSAHLMVGVVNNAAPERPGERNDNAHLHGASLSRCCSFPDDDP